MRRLARLLLTLCSAASLLLCVAVSVLWVRSYWRSDILTIGGQVRCTVWAERGGMFAVRTPAASVPYTGRSVPVDEVGRYEYAPGGRPNRLMPARFGRVPWGDTYLIVPHWVPLALFAVAPFAWVGRRLRLVRRTARGLCPSCGYDLRASPERCPECGTVLGVTA